MKNQSETLAQPTNHQARVAMISSMFGVIIAQLSVVAQCRMTNLMMTL
jgi:hypothetical protein